MGRTEMRLCLAGAVVGGLLTAAVLAQTSNPPRPANRFFQKSSDTRTTQDGFNNVDDESAVQARPSQGVPGRSGSGGQDRGASGLNGRLGTLDRDAMMRRFDENRDGRLGPEELAKARAALEAMRARGGFGGAMGMAVADRPGRVDQSELLRRFDFDKDGRLSPAERLLAIRELSRMRAAQ
ncbi:MAG: hypothetical protein KatS3mg110_1195 [Pirellulaceae bacterium]|nr:MAG: hypothetical protein KatS3mg110_1195 [Pirellulaceae bacterium]